MVDERKEEIKQRLAYLDKEIENGNEDVEEYYEAVELHKELDIIERKVKE